MPYEILILDDASTDGTPQILKEYRKRYPDKIKLFLRRKNSCHPTKNSFFLMEKARGRYLTFLEGDDYWCDKDKVWRQYKFLEENKEFSACITDIRVVNEESREIPELKFYEKKSDNIYTIHDLRQLRPIGMTSSLLMRNYFDREDFSVLYGADPMMGDITVFLLCILQGPIYQMEEKMTAYRYVSVPGENNFNSIHRENLYKEYMIGRYWIRLENYMKGHYDHNFEFLPMKYKIKELSSRYNTRAMLHLIGQSKNWREYFLVYTAQKYLLDSAFVQENGRKNSGGNRKKWGSYLRDRRPVILFGAGAAAAEYIDKYAWQGNILFLVDSDTRKQNRSFKGFLVRDPEEILKYQNTKVLITNKEHEEEIEEQLYRIGVEECYCYCSMQSARLRNMAGIRIIQKYEDGRE